MIAVEPEAVNFARLQHAIAEAGLTDVVETIQAAVAEVAGEGFLEVNPGHPGDHKLGAEGVPVAMTTIDDMLAARGWPEVSLIKVDVQGAEARVLAGAEAPWSGSGRRSSSRWTTSSSGYTARVRPNCWRPPRAGLLDPLAGRGRDLDAVERGRGLGPGRDEAV